MRGRWVLLAAAVALIVGAVAAPLTVADSTTSQASPSAEYNLSDLKQHGTSYEGAPPSMRYLSTYGSAVLRHNPPGPFSDDWSYVTPASTVQRNRVTLKTVRLASQSELEESLTVVVVAWQQDTREVRRGNTTREVAYARNVSVSRHNVDLGRGYDNATVPLPAHYDQPYQITMWVKEYPDARWRFTHKSIPTTQSPNIATLEDAWWFTAKSALLPGAVGIVVGLIGARRTLRRTGRGPGYGVGLWAIIVIVAAVVVLASAFYQTAVILANLPWVMGVLLGVLAYAGGLTMHNDVETFAFERLELQDALPLRNRETPGSDAAAGSPDAVPDGGTATANGDHGGDLLPGANGDADSTQDAVEIPGDEYKEELYEDHVQKPVVRREDGSRVIPYPGIRPWLARFFADPAELSLSSIRTRVRVEDGPVDEKILVNPDGIEHETDDGTRERVKKAVIHKPARIVRKVPGWDDATNADDVQTALLGAATALAAVAGPPAVGWQIADRLWAIPGVGLLAGLVVTYVLTHTAEDGYIKFEPAPLHLSSARATLTALQREYADAKLLDDFEEIAWKERVRTELDAREVERRRDRTLIEEQFGVGQDVGPEAGRNGHQTPGGAGSDE